jgi:transcription elongation factor GreA
MAKVYKLSPQRLKALQDEMNYLKTVREKEVAELIKEARSFGDLSENSEYDEAKNEQGKMYSRMAELEDILANYEVIEEVEEEETDGEYVRIGSTVTVLDKEFDEEVTYKIVGSQEADPMNGAISEDSPFGKALLGKNPGDDVTVDAPAGPVEYKILKVER